ncbi:MAG: Ig-like domain-containing protein, partial [Oscillospiraceae bacterium]|nr:Ig-like domain-containing protein [Oscillospiraceae bacterium]
MMKRMLSLLLAVIMILGVLPVSLAAEAEPETVNAIEIDFKEFAKEAAKQDFWQVLDTITTSDGYETKIIGNYVNTQGTNMTAETKAAYDEMRTWMAQTQDWVIDEERSSFKDMGGNRLYLCADEDVAWGVCHNVYYYNFADGRSSLALDVTAQQAGWYSLDMVLEQVKKGSSYPVDKGLDDLNRGYFSIIVNDRTVCAEYSFAGAELVSPSFGAVYLNEGVNDLEIKAVKNYVGNTVATPQYACKLQSVTLTPLAAWEVKQTKELEVDIAQFLPYGTTVSPETHEAVVSDGDLAEAAIREDGILVIKGIEPGDVTIDILEDGESVFAMDVTVLEYIRPHYDYVPLVMDFMAFAKAAPGQDWWQGLRQSTVDGIKFIGGSRTDYSDAPTDSEIDAYEQMLDWMAENQNWTIDREAPAGFEKRSSVKRLFINSSDADYGIRFYSSFLNKTDGTSSVHLAIDVPEAGDGWYNLELDVLNEAVTSKIANVSGTEGRGHGDIYVNGQKVYGNYFFAATADTRERVSMGAVWLKEGKNTVEINMISDHFDLQVSSRRAMNLRKIVFTPLQGLALREHEKEVLDLRTTYLAYDADLTDCALEYDENIVSAALADGILTVTALSGGSTTICVGELCEIPVVVGAKENIKFDFSKASDLTASGFDAIEDFDDLEEDHIYSDPWCFDALSGGSAKFSKTAGTAVFTGKELSFRVEVSEGGWFSPAMTVLHHEAGGKTSVYLDEYYLGTMDTQAAATALRTETLRPAELEAGEHTLTFRQESGELRFRSMTLTGCKEPQLSIFAKALSEKQYRVMETSITALWNGNLADDLVGADWSVQVSDESILEAKIVEAQVGTAPMLQVTGLQVTSDAFVTVTACVHGVESTVTVPVTVLEHEALERCEISILGTTTGLLPRSATQSFQFDMVGTDGDVIYPNEVDVVYAVSNDGIVSIDEENHTLFTLANGEVTVEVTVTSAGRSFTQSFDLTVADAGENKLEEGSSYFENGDMGKWYNYVPTGTEDAFLTHEIAEENGNKALKMTLNPAVTYASSGGKGSTLYMSNGYLAQVIPGHIYEMTFDFKAEGYKKAEGAAGELQLIAQMYDYASNAWSGALQGEVNTSVRYDASAVPGEWTTVKMRVRAPFEGEAPLYVMPTFGFDTHYAYAADKQLTGWEGSFFFDNFAIREVGFDRVESAISDPLEQLSIKETITLTPYTTTGSVIYLDEGALDGNVTMESSNEDVVKVVGNMGSTTVNNALLPTFTVQLVGLNDTAYLNSSFTIGTETRQSAFEVTMTDLPEIIRDVRYTLDGFDSAVLKKGETAKGELTGRTTQLTVIEQAGFESRYYTSSNTDVAVVDVRTGDVTCVGEGTAVITAYGLYDGLAKQDTAAITVTDDTDLVSISLSATADYVGVGNTLPIAVEGRKASGGVADMTLYPVAWTVDKEELALVSEDGKVTGLKPGTVTVTATVGVMRKAVTASVTLTVAENSELAAGDLYFNFHEGQSMLLEHYTLEDDGIEVNREKTYLGGTEINYKNSQAVWINTPVGESFVLDFLIKKDGWYHVFADGSHFYYLGCNCEIYVDDSFVGYIDSSAAGTNYSGSGGERNTIYLEAGRHTIEFLALESGTQMLGKLKFDLVEDPRQVELTLAAKEQLVVGESTSLGLQMQDQNGNDFYLLESTAARECDNWQITSISDPNVIARDGNTLTAVGVGTANVVVRGQMLGESFTREFAITVTEGSVISAELTAENTTVKPDAAPFALTVIAAGLEGELETLPEGVSVRYESSNPDVVTVSEDGMASVHGVEGTSLITAVITEGARSIEATLWISVTHGKTEPTLYTYEERENAQENVLKYDWAWNMKETAVREADIIIEHIDSLYEQWMYETFPRATGIALKSTDYGRICQYCKTDLFSLYDVYPWKIDVIHNPWKITCPVCNRDFPSNDFESYYKSGLDEHGIFHKENADPQYLVNELYPEMGEGWGVDDGFGYVTGIKDANGRPEVHTYIATYMAAVLYGVDGDDQKYNARSVLRSLMDAYYYTGDEKYGSAGAILIDRYADIFPTYDWSDSEMYTIYNYSFADGGGYQGKIIGVVWDAILGKTLTEAADAFWPSMDNPDVVTYLRGKASVKGVEADSITPETIRENVRSGIHLEFYEGCKTNEIFGNFGMDQAMLANAAVSLNDPVLSKEILEWTFTERVELSNTEVTGGDMMRYIIEDFSRDGLGNECSYNYNKIMVGHCLDAANALDGFTLVEGYDLWENPKFVNLFLGMMRFTVCGNLPINIHESGVVQGTWYLPDVEEMTTAFLGSGNVELAKAIYAANGNKTDGLRAGIFTKDPETGLRGEIERLVAEHGQWDMSQSDMMSGYGIAILREGPEVFLGTNVNGSEFFDYHMYFGYTNWTHAQKEVLNLDLEAFGLNLSSNIGYPVVCLATDPERMQWGSNTISNNTVVVNDKSQLGMAEGGFPLHFEDNGLVKVMDADCPEAYNETDIYRRSVVTVAAENGVHYAVDFFRVLGGNEHVYSFHAVSSQKPDTTGLSLVEQPFGTYAGADIPFGDWQISGMADASLNTGSGYSWLWDVARDASPETVFSVDWQIDDSNKRLLDSIGIHMRLTMLSEEPLTEVATAKGRPAQNGANPKSMEYLLVRNSGAEGLDSLFTTIIEPYKHDPLIDHAELVEITLLDGSEGITDRAMAVKTTLVGGRVDYIIYATNPECTYLVDNRITFRGFTGVFSYQENKLVYAWGSEATTLADSTIGAVAQNALPAVTGKVLDFTKNLADNYYLTLSMDTPVTEDAFEGRYVYVNTDGVENGAYRIFGAQVSGDTVTLDLKHQDLIRELADGTDLSKGYLYNISEGQTYTIPLSVTYDAASFFNHTTDQVVKSGYRMELQVGAEESTATYEAEGLVKGMKFDAATGKITWTPSKTQVGRYPIAVKAVNENGDTLATMEFVIYVVSYTGASYDPAVCKHSKAITYTVDGVDETICPACGTITKSEPEEEPIETIAIAGTNMNLGNELALNFMFPKSLDASKSYTAIITQTSQGKTVKTTEVASSDWASFNNTLYKVTASVRAMEMADELAIRIVDEEGNVYNEAYTTSVRAYGMKALAAASSSDEMKTLVVDMLNYGAEAQTKFSYNTGDLANKELTEAHKALATGDVACSNEQVKGKNYVGTNLALEDKIELNLFFANVTTDMYAEVSYTDFKGNVVSYIVDGEDFALYAGTTY